MSSDSPSQTPPPAESKASQRLITFAVVLAFAFGLIVPALVLAHNANDKPSEAIGGVHLNASEVKGRELFSHTCTVCHTLAAVKSVGRIGPNLDVRVGDEISTRSGAQGVRSGHDPRRSRARPRQYAGRPVPGQGSGRRRRVRRGRRRPLTDRGSADGSFSQPSIPVEKSID